MAIVALAAPSCGKPAPKPKRVEAPTVHLIHPQQRKIVRVVGQPSFIVAYERTSIFPKVTGYIEKWNVDIGDKVKKGDVLARLFVPELVEDFGTKKATVELDKERIELALTLVQVADADVNAAEASLVEAKAILEKFQAEVDRWDSEVSRLGREVQKGVVDPQVLLESRNQWRAGIAARDAAKATIAKAEAELISRKSTLAKTKVDVAVARADLLVAQSEARRLKAWVGYLDLIAPYDGIVEARNANTFDFVAPSNGDPTAMRNAPHLSPENAAPIYVVDRTDIVRIFVDIPERDANYVQIGTKAKVLARAYRDKEICASVTRTSWALNVTSRTLRAEIDLPNTNSQILPGMYAYAKVIIERADVLALPADALVPVGDQTFFWKYEKGHAARTEVETGVSDGEWTEVTNYRLLGSENKQADDSPWTTMDGSEQVIHGDLSNLTNDAPVKTVPAKDPSIADDAS
jgi:multidrug efflux pump subunit AcrA (membrane-fusion protein)